MNGFGQMSMMSLGFPASPGFGAPGSNYGGRGRGRGRGRFCCSLRPLSKTDFFFTDERRGSGRGRGGHGGGRAPAPETSDNRLRKMVIKLGDDEVCSWGVTRWTRLVLIVSIRTLTLSTTPLDSLVFLSVDGVKALSVSWKVSESV